MAGVLKNIFHTLYGVFVFMAIGDMVFIEAYKKELGRGSDIKGMYILRCYQEQIPFAVIKPVFIYELHPCSANNIDQLKEIATFGSLRKPVQFYKVNFKRTV